VAAPAILGRPATYDQLPSFVPTDTREYAGFACAWDRVVFRGDRATREFIALWMVGDRVGAGMNLNVWDVTDDV
jgi:3-phenylpropionate/trans-cinnamate dioxygenase ferredoxin reductase subunit